MACRCPVVSTAVGGALDLVKEGVNGHVVPVGDPVAMADRIVRVLALPDPQWRALSDAAHATATGYDWDAATALFEDALRTAIRKAGR
jgi:glycosyltransferase involved in cell wall biosynthesis